MGIDMMQFMKQSMTSGAPQSWQCQFCGCENLMEDKKCCNCASPRHISKELKEGTQQKTGENQNVQTGAIDMQVFQQMEDVSSKMLQQMEAVSTQMFQQTDAVREQMLKKSETVRTQAFGQPGAAGQRMQTQTQMQMSGQQAVQRPAGPTEQEIRIQKNKALMANLLCWFFAFISGVTFVSGVYNQLPVFSVFMLAATILFSPLRKKILPKVHPAIRIMLAFGCMFISVIAG